MKNQHPWYYLAITALLLCSVAFTEEPELEPADEEEAAQAEMVLRPRNLARRAPASLGVSGTNYWKYSGNDTNDFAVGLFLTEDLKIQSSSNREDVEVDSLTAPEDEVSETALPVLNLRAGYRIVESVSLFGNLGVDFKNGIRDPFLGAAWRFPVAKNVTSIATLTASLPFSPESRDLSKYTTLTASLSPIFEEASWFVGANLFFSYHLYGSNAETELTESTSDGLQNSGDSFGDSNSSLFATTLALKPTTTTGGAIYIGRTITSYLSGNVAFATASSYLDSGDFSWTSELTAARLTAGYQGFAGSLAFSFLSDPLDDETTTFPTQPHVGFRLQYVFGDHPVLGYNRSESLPYVR